MMNLEISDYKNGERPDVTLPTVKMFELLGEDGIRALVSQHYDLLVQSKIKALFPGNPVALDAAKEHSADFFIQICGGPMYFNKNRGKPLLIRRHLPFTITAEGRITWLECYRTALQNTNLPEEVIFSFWNYLDVFSKWMVNTY